MIVTNCTLNLIGFLFISIQRMIRFCILSEQEAILTFINNYFYPIVVCITKYKTRLLIHKRMQTGFHYQLQTIRSCVLRRHRKSRHLLHHHRRRRNSLLLNYRQTRHAGVSST